MATLLYGVLMLIGVALLAITAARILVGGLDADADRTGRPTGARGVGARQILDERYAAGQLTTEEYQQRSRVLREGGS